MPIQYFNLKLKGLQCFLLYFHLNFDIFLYVKYFLEIIGDFQFLPLECTALIDTKGAGEEDSLLRQTTDITSTLNAGFLIGCSSG